MHRPTISELLPEVSGSLPAATASLRPTGLADDSRVVAPGDLFFAIPGATTSGIAFASQAVASGAVAIVHAATEPFRESGVPGIAVSDVRSALASAAVRFFGAPTSSLLTFGVTGTNGKTSSCWILAEALAALGRPAAQIGTLGMRLVADAKGSTEFISCATTTPGPIVLQRFLAEAHAAGMVAAAFEVSSHAVIQRRAANIDWDRIIFTNLTRDHLDYHGDLESYFAAKERLFVEDLPASSKSGRGAVINIDDPRGRALAQKLRARNEVQVWTFSADGLADADGVMRSGEFFPRQSKLSFVLMGEEINFKTALIGRFNAVNLLGAALALRSAGFSGAEVAAGLAAVRVVPGRLELVGGGACSVFVDYAHTPDGLVSAQRALREVMAKGRLITVFGCGGARDRGKRPLMGRAVAELADYGIVTSDNPRDEDPGRIIEDILPGLRGVDSFAFEAVPDRRAAIFRAVALAEPDDVILVAGKGHEEYQEINGVRYPFADREVCLEALTALQLETVTDAV